MKQNSGKMNYSKCDYIFKSNTILVVEPRPMDTLLKKLLDNVANTYRHNNFGTMKTWSSPKKLGEDNNEAYVFNYLTFVTFLLLKKLHLYL